MKKFHVYLTYTSMKSTQRVEVEAIDATDARRIATVKYPNAVIRGPGAVAEVTSTGNTIALH